MLVYHDAVLMQRLIAVAVKFLGKESLAGSEGVCGIHDDEVIVVLLAADKFQAVLIMDVNPLILQLTGDPGKKALTYLNDLFVDLHKVNMLNLRVFHKLPDRAAVSGADDEHAFHVRMNRHRHMNNHLMVDELVLLGQHHIAVQHKESAELRRFKNINSLKFALSAVKLLIYLD